MQLKSFKHFVCNVVAEGNRLQKFGIDGQRTTKNRFTTIQRIAIGLAIFSVATVRNGFSQNFSGFVIGFLGIFLGLFANVVVSLYDKRKSLLLDGLSEAGDLEKTRRIKIKNHLVQFTGLTSYAMLLAIEIIMLLTLVLMDNIFQRNLYSYSFISSVSDISFTTFFSFILVLLLVVHRFLITYLLIIFFSISIYSITSYFSFLQSEYKRIKIK